VIDEHATCGQHKPCPVAVVRPRRAASIRRHNRRPEIHCAAEASVTRADPGPGRSIPIFVRPCTSDLATAQISFAGEFDAAIAAAKPRIVPGCEAVFGGATATRRNLIDASREKILSINPD